MCQVRFSDYPLRFLEFSIQSTFSDILIINEKCFRYDRNYQNKGITKYIWAHDHEGTFSLCGKYPHFKRINGTPPTLPVWSSTAPKPFIGCKYMKSTYFY